MYDLITTSSLGSTLIEINFSDKEVQGYYEDGMRVPDDVCLLWTDDKYAIPSVVKALLC